MNHANSCNKFVITAENFPQTARSVARKHILSEALMSRQRLLLNPLSQDKLHVSRMADSVDYPTNDVLAYRPTTVSTVRHSLISLGAMAARRMLSTANGRRSRFPPPPFFNTTKLIFCSAHSAINLGRLCISCHRFIVCKYSFTLRPN